MLNWFGQRYRHCDGIDRRGFLRIGALAAGGLSLPGLLRAEAQAGQKATGKSIINIILSGGPSHMDMFDLKPNAPKEFRGEFRPINTSIPGFDICEHMPMLAGMGDRITAIRSITGMNNEHSNAQSDTGWPLKSLESLGGRPSIGSVMSKVFGPAQTTATSSAPTFVDLSGGTRPGFLGQVFAGYRPDGTGKANLTLNRDVSRGRLGDRRELLSGFDTLRRDIDGSGMMTALDSFTERAVSLITSGDVARALDTTNEDPRRLQRYGMPQDRDASNFILSRRLIEAGARCVSFTIGGWDTHQNNFKSLSTKLPNVDRAMSALIEDLDVRGRLDDTIIMMSGEFGRTPRVNGTAGRDHWNRAASFFLAGGGLKHGQYIGATNRLGEVAQDRPVHIQQVFATVYQQLGIDPNAITLIDQNGRPQYLVDNRQVIGELI
ncbi:MAG: DUF1501 domain-containing protein [Planctomycetota bacterium]|nr:DUF1501 domain-containing protein [Planctomycetota bacterium]MDA1164339.1 DUF1501 domain-containing protein [Planctomycetota bacterium]